MGTNPKLSKETKEWLKELKRRGIREFEFKDLPEDLKIEKRLHRCRIGGYIKKIGRKKGHNIWKLS